MMIPSSSTAFLVLMMSFGTAHMTASAQSMTTTTTTTTTIPLIPHHVQEHRRRHLLQEEEHQDQDAPRHPPRRHLLTGGAQQVGALYQGYGTHYVDLWCGTPPQRQTVIVDTGSGVTAFPCKPCNNCGAPKYHIDNYFEGSKSSTYQKSNCDNCMRGHCQSKNNPDGGECIISMSYQEGSSWKAFEVTDTCYVGGPHSIPLLEDTGSEDIDPNHASHFAFDLIFGCQSSVTGLFKTQLADGIMGMDDGRTTFWQQMYDSGKMGVSKQFSLCYARQPTADREGTEAGAMTLGGYDERLHETPLVWSTGTNDHSGFFDVKIRAVYLREGSGGELSMSASPDAKIIKLDMTHEQLNVESVIVDSGTTDTYWNINIQKKFQAAFKELTGGRAYTNNEIALTTEQLAALPTFLIQLEGDEISNDALMAAGSNQLVAGLAGSVDPDHPLDVLLALPPSHYMEYSKSSGKYTSQLNLDEDGGTVLGANTMMGHDVVFDVTSHKIGWSESTCDYTKLVTDNGYLSALSGVTDLMSQTQTIKEEIAENGTEETSNSKEKASDSTNAEDASDKKKEHSGGNDFHDKQTPDDDIKKQISSLVGVCASWECRGVAFAAVMLMLLCGVCVGRCCCSSRSSKPQLYQRANAGEMELPKGNFSSYKDDPDDAEFGSLDDE